MLAETLRNRDTQCTTTVEFTEVDDTWVEGGLFEKKQYDIVGTSNNLTPSQIVAPHPIITQAMWNVVMKRLSTLQKKVWFIKMGEKP